MTTSALVRVILDHTELGDPPRFNGVKLAEAAFALGRAEAHEVIERLISAAFLAGANPDENGSRGAVDGAIKLANSFLASLEQSRKAA